MTSAEAMLRSAVPGAAASAAVACSHCGLTVPSGLVDRGAAEQFCCAGCRAVFEVIRGCGLENYYRLRRIAPSATAPGPVRQSGRRYAEFNHPEFQQAHVRARPDGLLETEFLLEGVHCAACVWLVERLGVVASHVVSARLELGAGRVTLVWDPQRGTLSQAALALDRLGYVPHPARGASAAALRRRADRALLIRIAVAGAIAGNVMLMAFALYGGFFSGMEAGYTALFRWLSMGLTLLSLAWPGRVFYRGAWAALRTRSANLDLPIALGLSAGAAAGVWNTLVGTGEVYFDSLSVLVLLLLVGRWIQARQQRIAADGLELLLAVTPSVAWRVEGNTVVETPIGTLVEGDLVEVRAGDTLPVDGAIEQGVSTLDQSLLTGESRPVAVRVGDAVCAGTVNLAAPLRVRATAAGERTRVGKLMQLVETGAARAAPIVRLADRVAYWLTLAMILIATATVLLWWRTGVEPALNHAAAVLLVACPCALGLATPLVLTVAIGRAARRGMLIKCGATLEALSRPGRIFLDKTGTLTEGRPALLRWMGSPEVARLASALERGSSHPIALALRRGLATDEDPSLLVDAVVQNAAGGIHGQVDGRAVLIGSPAFVRARTSRSAAGVDDRLCEILAEGLTPVLVAVDGVVCAVGGVGDPLRPDACEAVAALRGMGWRVDVLSGDHADVVRAVGHRLGLEDAALLGGATPETKLAVVEVALKEGPVVMVGDGVNDAAALAAATVGIAVHGGAEASLAAADAYVTRPGLSAVVEILAGGRRALGVVRRAVTISLAYNTFAVGLAVTGWIHPVVAAVLMPLSSLSVLAAALSARTFATKDGS